MSAYKNYVSWNKPSTSSGATKKDTKYESTFTKSKKAPDEEKSATSRIALKYSAYNPGHQQNTPVTHYRPESRLKATKDSQLHPPVSYRPLSRPTAPRSRDPSPEKSSYSSSYNRLCPKTYSRSVSRELEPVLPVAKYGGRSSLHKDDLLARSSRSSVSREDLSTRSSEDFLSRFGAKKEAPKEQKYITSRFLPKNSVEKSYTAYTRPSTLRQHEASRKNRELLNVLAAQAENSERSRPSSRLSYTTQSEDVSGRIPVRVPVKKEPEMETVSVASRSTSPTPPSGGFRGRGKVVEKEITRVKVRETVDKGIQLEESSKGLKFGGTGKISTAAPWSSFLDMKFSSPDQKKSIPNLNSSKSIVSTKSDSKIDKKGKKASPSPPKGDKKALPPQIPSKIGEPKLHSGNATNKDFRKSVLNMNPDGTRKLSVRSTSVSSADSETDVSESMSSSKGSKLPQRVDFRSRRSPSSDGSSSSQCEEPKSADEQSEKPPPSPRLKPEAAKAELEAKNFIMRALAPVTGFFKKNEPEKATWLEESAKFGLTKSGSFKRVDSEPSLNDDTTVSTSLPRDSDSGQKPPLKHVDSGEVAWWLDKNTEQLEDVQIRDKPGKLKPKIKQLESGEPPWWLNKNQEPPEGVTVYQSGSSSNQRPQNRRQDSGEVGWWMDKSGEGGSSSAKLWFQQKNESDAGSRNIMDAEYQERHKLRHIDSGERSWWVTSSENLPAMVQAEEQKQEPKYAIRHQDSGEEAWWLKSGEEFAQQAPLGDRASPEGLEMPKEEESGRLSPYDNVPMLKKGRPNLFISRHRNIDEILGGCGQIWSPIREKAFSYGGSEEGVRIEPEQVKIHDSSAQRGVIQPNRIDSIGGFPKSFSPYGKLDDAALQLYKDGDYGSYLDLEASISEQQEEFEGFQSNKKNSIVLRTQLSVRVHTIIEKLLTSEGRELRRALFSLKQIFQEDKDLVHEFVQNDGLSCLIKVGSEADQNYQNYILRALGQVMLYVDGMNGVMDHNPTIQWLYSLISSKFRLVVKTALKLLLVFVEYTDSNCLLLIKAVQSVDFGQGLSPWSNIMKLLKDFDAADTELLIYATTLINKVLNGVPDQDTYYDQTDALEEQEIERIIQRYMAKPGTDLDLLQQFQIYEAVLQYEDGEDLNTTPRHLDESIRKTLRHRKSLSDSGDRRKSRRHSTGTVSLTIRNNNNSTNFKTKVLIEDDESSSSHSSDLNNSQINGCYKDTNEANDAGVTPALRRRRERAERQRSFMQEQQETAALLRKAKLDENTKNENEIGNYTNALQQRLLNQKDTLMNAANKLDSEENQKQPWIMSMHEEPTENETERSVLLQLKRENTVKDLTQKLANQNILHSPSDENKPNRIGDMTGLISKAKEGLAKSKSQANIIKSPTSEAVPKLAEVKKSENELRWEELVASLDRPLNLCDMDFTDLASEDEEAPAPAAVGVGVPPPPPMVRGGAPPPPPARCPPPVPPPAFGVALQRAGGKEGKAPPKKSKKTVKLFWREVRDDPIGANRTKGGFIWDELNPVVVDTQKLEHLFESRAKDLITKKQQEMNKNKEIIVLDPKRSNAINIGMTKLPPPRSIKTAILKMDATIMNREGIEKLLTMLPTEEERSKIQEAQAASPDLPLGSAEQFLLTLASISELPARLKLWAFKLDFENSEREIAEPLMDLKQGVELLRVNKTFRGILSTLLSIGNFLNGNEVKGFQIDYLAKVPEVKDTVHKHSLLHHLCHIVMEKFPDASDLYSEIGAITRASKIDFDELSLNIQRLEADCKASWDHLKLIAKHDGSTMMKVKMSDFLADCAERIILIGIIHRRVMNRFHKFILWLGIPLHQINDTKANEFCRIVSEFALEYRTTRERVLQQLEKKANHRERNKTRGKMITDIGKFRTKEDRADAELRQLLGSDISDVESMQGTLTWRRPRRESTKAIFGQNGHLTDCDDEILESLVKTATKGTARTAPRERKRTRHADRKSLRRTLKNGLSEEEKKHLSAYIKGY